MVVLDVKCKASKLFCSMVIHSGITTGRDTLLDNDS